MYEVLDLETKLTIHDPKCKSVTLSKYEKVRSLQDNIIAYQDQAWGDGGILQNYRCSPGIPVDFYRTGYKTHVPSLIFSGKCELFFLGWIEVMTNVT